MNPRISQAARAHWRKVAAIAVLALVVLAVDRLTHLPTAQHILEERKWDVPVGHELILAGLGQGPLLTFESGAGDGAWLEAGPVRLDDGSRVRQLAWQVSKLDGNAVGDNKVKVQIDTLARGDEGRVVVQRAGEDVRPELLIGGANVPLRIEAGLAIGSQLIMPPLAITADGKAMEPEGLGIGFTLQPGGYVSIAFPTHADGTPKGLTLATGERERKGPRLQVRQVGVRSEGAALPWRSACAAPEGKHLWGTLLRGWTSFDESECQPDLLAVTALEIGSDQVSVDLAGSAYVANSNAPATARWWSWATTNPVLSVVMVLLMTALGRWFWKTASGKEQFPG